MRVHAYSTITTPGVGQCRERGTQHKTRFLLIAIHIYLKFRNNQARVVVAIGFLFLKKIKASFTLV